MQPVIRYLLCIRLQIKQVFESISDLSQTSFSLTLACIKVKTDSFASQLQFEKTGQAQPKIRSSKKID